MIRLKCVPWSTSVVCHFLTSLQCLVNSKLFKRIEEESQKKCQPVSMWWRSRDSAYQLSMFPCLHRGKAPPSFPYPSPKILLQYTHKWTHSYADRLGHRPGLPHPFWGSQTETERRTGLLIGGRWPWVDNVKWKNGKGRLGSSNEKHLSKFQVFLSGHEIQMSPSGGFVGEEGWFSRYVSETYQKSGN